MQASEPALLHHLGLDPAQVPILALKSSVHFRGAYQAMARAILVARAPGPVAADLADLPYRNLRPGLRIAGRRTAALTG
jgi:microcystin degradation protein MlrC